MFSAKSVKNISVLSFNPNNNFIMNNIDAIAQASKLGTDDDDFGSKTFGTNFSTMILLNLLILP